MFLSINIFFIVLIHIVLKIIYLKSNPNFKQIIKIYILFYFLLIFIYFYNFFEIKNLSQDIVYLFINFLIFFSYILTIGLKKINSPTFYILEFFNKNNVTSKAELILFLKNKKIFEERLIELESDNLILIKNDKIKLSKQGEIVSKIMNNLSNFFNIKVKG